MHNSTTRSLAVCKSMWPLLVAVLFGLLGHTTWATEESLNAYIPALHKRMYEEYNVLVLGDLSVTKAAFRGSLAVQGKADLADFDIAGDKMCNPDVRALVVGGALAARMGSINNGYAVVGRRSNIHHSVRMNCTNRVEQYDPVRNEDLDFPAVRIDLIRELSDLCASTGSGTVETVNETMTFDPGEIGYSCYSVFNVSTADMRLIHMWKFAGTDFYRNVIIVVSGLRSDFRDFRMEGFNPRRTLIVFCAVYGSFGLYNARFHGSLFAPTSSFTSMETIVNGSIIAASLRGSIATLNVPYVTC